MQSDFQTNNKPYNNYNSSNTEEMIYDYLRCLKKYWKQFLVLVILAVVAVNIYMNASYKPTYVAKVTYAVNKMEDTNASIFLAKSLSASVSAVTSTADFKEDLMEEAGEGKVNPDYKITSLYTEGTNLFSVYVSSGDPDNANNVLEAVEAVYPVWASKANGTVELQLVDRTNAPEIPENPYSPIDSLLKGLILGLGICFAFCTWYAMKVKTVRSESDMRRITGKNCISLIPEVNIKKRKESTKEHLLINKKRIDWGFKQSILAAQSRIEKQMAHKSGKVLMVTSTLPQEGKSMTAVNLALAFSKREKKVLLIDGDLRNPSVEKLIGLEGSRKGLVDFFDQAEISEIIVSKEGIDIIGAGMKKSDISGSISEAKMLDLMIYLRSRYEYIIIDTPPTHLFTDAEILEKYADCVLYVVRYDMAEINEIKEGISPFIRDGKLIGYMINRNPGGYSTYGKYGYSKYGHYGKYKRYIDLDESDMNTEDSL